MHAILGWLSRRPLWFLHALGTASGWLTWVFSPAYRRRLAANAALAGVPAAMARQSVAAAGRLIAELPFLWLRPVDSTLGDLARVDGEALVQAAHERGRGIVFLTPHLGCFEVMAQVYAERYGPRQGPITVLYRPARKAALRDIVDRSRVRPGLDAAPATLAGVRQMIRALRRGEAVGLLPDQVPPAGMGVWVPFFGKAAYTMTLAARLVQQTGATPLLAWGERLPRGHGYVVHVEALGEALPLEHPQAAEACAATINRAMEALILRCPQQYLWGYNRYKAPRVEADPRA